MQSILAHQPAFLKERRLTARLRRTWKECADGRLPSWADIQDLDIGQDWASCFAIDLEISHPDPYFIFLGDRLGQFADFWMAANGVRQRTILDVIGDGIDEAVMTRRAISQEKTLLLDGGSRMAFRSVMLPLSDNGEDVSHAFGAANGRLIGPDTRNSN